MSCFCFRRMASSSKSSLFLLGIFVLFITNVSSYDEELINQGKYAKRPVSAVAPVVAPKPSPPLKPSTPPPAPAGGKSPPPPPTAVPPVAPAPPTPVYPPIAPAPAPAPVAPIVKSNKDCVPLCENRCQLHSRKRVCIRACSTCCVRCKCVPPGTYGNREVCGKCYTDMITHNNRFKCP